jgi:hypothetical protein
MTVKEVVLRLVAPHFKYELGVLEVRRTAANGDINLGGQYSVHMGVGFVNL